MKSRRSRISASITRAVLGPAGEHRQRASAISRILAFLSFLNVPLKKHQSHLFSELRHGIWQIDEEEYRDAFGTAHVSSGLQAVGDLGYSGSVFFTTPDGKFLVKSLNRYFEFDHFENHMLRPYVAHMKAHAASSLLVRITDYLSADQLSIASLTGLAPTRYMIMENLLGGRDGDPQRAGDWQNFDLKPQDYFFPERDIANGALAPESVKDKLIDRFDDKILITKEQYNELRLILEADTALLEATNCVDYSLFLVRYPAELTRCEPVKSNRNGWREGLLSADGKWRYRLILLDFFFSKHRMQPRLLTALVKCFNIVGRKGPMSITTTPHEYRNRFLRMVDGLVKAT